MNNKEYLKQNCNYQIVASLLGIKISSSEEKMLKKILENCQYKIASMKLINKELKCTTRFLVNIHQCAEGVFSQYHELAELSNDKTEFSIDKSFMWEIETAVPFVLILNDWISKAINQNIWIESQSNLAIEITKSDQEYIISLKNNNQIEKINLKNHSEVIKNEMFTWSLSNRLNGSFECSQNPGAELIIKFREPFFI